MLPPSHDLPAIAPHFQFHGSFVSAEPFGGGHINDTFRLTFSHRGDSIRYLLQRINDNVFKAPAALMQNIERVTAHLQAKLADHPDRDRHVAALIPTRDGTTFHRDPSGNFWRAHPFIERTHTADAIQSPAQAYEAARAFARFQTLLADLPHPRLHDTIPDFHNTPARFAALQHAVAADCANRARLAQPEIDFAFRHVSFVGGLVDAGLPERVIHNDAKLNNVLLDDATNEAICVIDLDTVMPGFAPCDFGDMVRSMTSPAPEDEPNPANVTMRLSVFEAIVRGYLSRASSFLTDAEKNSLVLAGKIITLENGFRFLADFLQGDTYYRTHHEHQNLHRARAQFALVDSITRQEPQMRRIVANLSAESRPH